MTVLRLLHDIVYRQRDAYIGWGIVAALVWSVIAMAPGSPSATRSAIVALSMAIAFVAGPFMSLGSLSSREIVALPASRRELWLAQWIAGVIVGPAWNLVTKLAGSVLTPGSIGVETLSISVLCDVAYCGALYGLVPAAPRTRAGAALLGLIARLPSVVIGTLFLAVGFSAPVLVGAYLPVAWSSFAGPGVVVLGGALTLLGFRHSPPVVGRSALRPAPTVSVERTAGARAARHSLRPATARGISHPAWTMGRTPKAVRNGSSLAPSAAPRSAMADA